jgi:hypothetical protein
MAKQEDKRTELRAVDTFKRLCRRKGWKYRKAAKGSNCDFFVDNRRVEIKGSKSPKSIPDTYHSEFEGNNENLKFKPEWLFVIYFPPKGNPHISAIPKKEINKYKHHTKIMVRWANELKTKLAHDGYRKIPNRL